MRAGDVTADADLGGFAQPCQLERRLFGANVLQAIDQRLRVDGRQGEVQIVGLCRTDQGHVGEGREIGDEGLHELLVVVVGFDLECGVGPVG